MAPRMAINPWSFTILNSINSLLLEPGGSCLAVGSGGNFELNSTAPDQRLVSQHLIDFTVHDVWLATPFMAFDWLDS